MQAQSRFVPPYRRRAAVVAQVAVCSTVILGMGALVIDIGSMYTTQTELQASADAAALAAAGELAGHPEGDPEQSAIDSAGEYAGLNHVRGGDPAILDQDVEFGRSQFDAASGKFHFQAGGANFDSVRVTVRRLGGGAGGSTLVRVPFLFGPIFGQSGTQLEAKAAAVLIPRDIAVVIDLSGSMNDDSELRHYKAYQGEVGQWRAGVEINLRDCWCALNGPEPARPYIPGAENETEYATDTGPTIGAMNTWGNPITPETYNPTTDPGLWYIPKGTNCTVAAARTSLAARGYSNDEITYLFSGAKDSASGHGNQFRNRTAVILGLASWKSGRTGGKPGGNGDVYVDDGEITLTAYPSFRASTWTWWNYIVDYTGTGASSYTMYAANHAFQYRYGLKTFTNFLLEMEAFHNQTNNLWQTPEQPVRAVKDAVQAMTDVIVGLDSLDHMSLEIFALTAHHEVNLSDNLQAVPNRLYQMQSAHYDSTTNMGGGLLTAMAELSSSRARSAAAKVIVLMSDGKPNIDERGNYISESAPGIVAWVEELAQQAADQHIRIYTISVGGDSDIALMTEVASIAGGQHFHAEGTPAEYADQLEMIFRSLGGKRPVALIE